MCAGGGGITCPIGTPAGVVCADGFISSSTAQTEIGVVTGSAPASAVSSDYIVAGYYPVTLWGRTDGALCATVWSDASTGVPYCNGPTRKIAVATFDGGGSALSGTKTACTIVTDAVTISKVTLLADQSGDATVDVKTVAYGSFTGPGSTSSITASATPALTADPKYQDTTLTGWTTSVGANTALCFSGSGWATVTQVSIILEGR